MKEKEILKMKYHAVIRYITGKTANSINGRYRSGVNNVNRKDIWNNTKLDEDTIDLDNFDLVCVCGVYSVWMLKERKVCHAHVTGMFIY